MFAKEIVRILEKEIEMLIEKKHKLAEKITKYEKKYKEEMKANMDLTDLITQLKMSMEELTGRLYEANWMLKRVWETINNSLNN